MRKPDYKRPFDAADFRAYFAWSNGRWLKAMGIGALQQELKKSRFYKNWLHRFPGLEGSQIILPDTD
jgi:hypothetical protein